jgi:bacterioferritin-associated ferredoxin
MICKLMANCYEAARSSLPWPRPVYVCNCNGIRERDVRAAVEEGAVRPRQVFDRHDCRPQCAKCVCEVRRMIDDAAEALRLAAE